MPPRSLFARILVVSCALALAGCDDGPVLTDDDGGTDAAVPFDGGGLDAGMTDERDAGMIDAGPADGGTDGGPPCEDLEPTPSADPLDGAWQRQFANPGVGGAGLATGVSAFAFGTDDTVYIGGSFTSAGYTDVSNVAAWNATTGWHALGDGLPDGVARLTMGADGALYAAHGAPAIISRWDGTSWSTFAETDGSIYALTVVEGHLFAAGNFTTIGGVAQGSVAYHDGTTWQGYAGMAPDDSIYAVSAPALDDVCIAGQFTTLGVIDAQYVACWNGDAWQARSLPAPPPPSGPFGPDIVWYANAIDRDPADGSLVVAGLFEIGDASTQGGSIARWTGTEWALIGGGLMRYGLGDVARISGLAITASGLYVGGNLNYANASMDPLTEVGGTARWDGTTWHSMGGLGYQAPFGPPERDPGPVGVVAAGPDGSVYFAGLVNRADSMNVNHVVRWDGTYWKGLRASGERYDGVSGEVGALARHGTCATYVGGNFRYAGPVRANGIARYTLEGGYEALGDGVLGTVRDIEVTRSGRVYAAGEFVDESGVAFRNVAMWDGIEWRGFGSVENSVSAVAVAEGSTPEDDVVYVGGQVDTAGGERVTNLAMWNGSTWTDLGAGMLGHEDPERPGSFGLTNVSALIVDPDTGDLIVGGRFGAIGVGDAAITTNNVARWDGSAWHAYGDGAGDASSTVLAMTLWNGRLAVARSFANDDPLRFAVWNGSAWEPIGAEQPGGTPAAIDGVGDTFFVAGNFAGSGHVHAFDGTTWSSLDTGVDDVALAVSVGEGGVFFGGVFNRAGNTGAGAIARWQYSE